MRRRGEDGMTEDGDIGAEGTHKTAKKRVRLVPERK
jgi:hypothetical protein